MIAGVLRMGAGGRRRRRLRSDPHGGRVAAAWDDAVRWLDALGIHLHPDETPLEFAARARSDTRFDGEDAAPGDARGGLAWAETRPSTSVTTEPSDELCEAAEAAAASVGCTCARACCHAGPQQARHLVG